MNKILLLAVSMFVLTILISLTSVKILHAHGQEAHASKVKQGEITYTKNIEPLFKKRCAKCHGSKSPEHMEFV